MTIYVTGASGFIGSAIVRYLDQHGGDVRAIARKPSPALPDDDSRQVHTSHLFDGDWLDADCTDAAIIHCAGLSDPRISFASRNELYDREVGPHVAMMESLIARGWRGRLIFISSGGTVYGDTDKLPISENVLPQPKNDYGLYNLFLEQAFAFLSQRFGTETISLRVSNPYGGFVRKPGQGIIPILIDAILEDRTIELFGDGSALRDYIAMDDLCRAVRLAVDTDLSDPSLTLNIGSGRGVSVRELISHIEEMTGRSIRTRQVALGANVHSNILCCARARDQLGWSAEIAIETGLAEMLCEAGLIE
ncbi:NAD-dependent epimerase/dehydratase family protein [Parasphingopyxis sp.]|uniref:NAD-dependent epimerase/dehydratase family protein n=1 Tax=Parasphingopyxis sp. TaxID=1920299 RepID=UPI002629BFA9|nr:NAD-dependent epimerase/dehydratase family protein [Parasphingopyxis sp.]